MTNDNESNSEFGLPKSRTPFDRYLGKYVFIHPLSSGDTAGKITGIEAGYLVLNPFQGAIFDKEKGLIKQLIEDESLFLISDAGNIEPTTRENIENACYLSNKKNLSKD